MVEPSLAGATELLHHSLRMKTPRVQKLVAEASSCRTVSTEASRPMRRQRYLLAVAATSGQYQKPYRRAGSAIRENCLTSRSTPRHRRHPTPSARPGQQTTGVATYLRRDLTSGLHPEPAGIDNHVMSRTGRRGRSATAGVCSFPARCHRYAPSTTTLTSPRTRARTRPIRTLGVECLVERTPAHRRSPETQDAKRKPR